MFPGGKGTETTNLYGLSLMLSSLSSYISFKPKDTTHADKNDVGLVESAFVCPQRNVSKIFKISKDASIFTAECLAVWDSIKLFKQ